MLSLGDFAVSGDHALFPIEESESESSSSKPATPPVEQKIAPRTTLKRKNNLFGTIKEGLMKASREKEMQIVSEQRGAVGEEQSTQLQPNPKEKDHKA